VGHRIVELLDQSQDSLLDPGMGSGSMSGSSAVTLHLLLTSKGVFRGAYRSRAINNAAATSHMMGNSTGNTGAGGGGAYVNSSGGSSTALNDLISPDYGSAVAAAVGSDLAVGATALAGVAEVALTGVNNWLMGLTTPQPPPKNNSNNSNANNAAATQNQNQQTQSSTVMSGAGDNSASSNSNSNNSGSGSKAAAKSTPPQSAGKPLATLDELLLSALESDAGIGDNGYGSGSGYADSGNRHRPLSPEDAAIQLSALAVAPAAAYSLAAYFEAAATAAAAAQGLLSDASTSTNGTSSSTSTASSSSSKSRSLGLVASVSRQHRMLNKI
jgi:hypothetical protein